MMTPRRYRVAGLLLRMYVLSKSWFQVRMPWQSFTNEPIDRGKPTETMISKAMHTEIRAKAWACVLKPAVALLLLFAVPGLSTIAKINWYLPQSDPGHYLTTATKMKVADSHSVFKIGTLQPARKLFFSPQPEITIFLEERGEIFIARMLSTAILFQRPPPCESA